MVYATIHTLLSQNSTVFHFFQKHNVLRYWCILYVVKKLKEYYFSGAMGHRVVNLGVCLLNSNYNVRIVYQSIFSSCALNLRKKSNKADTNSIPPSINLTVLLTGGPGSTGKSLMVTTNSKNKWVKKTTLFISFCVLVKI